MRKLSHTILVIVILLCSNSFLDSQESIQSAQSVPHLVRIHGTLHDFSGFPRTVGVRFSLYENQSGGEALWSELQNVTPTTKGAYTVLLGYQSNEGVPSELFENNAPRWLGVQVEAELEQPRILLVSVPYALKAHDSDLFAGHPLSDFRLNSMTQFPTDASAFGATSTTKVNSWSLNPPAASASSVVGLNFLTKSDGAGGVAPSMIFDDGSNVGIGTTTPASKLDISLTSSNPLSALTAATTLTNSVSNSSKIVTALNLNVRDASVASNISKQTMRLTYTRDSAATGGVGVYDTLFTATPIIDSDAPYSLIGLNMESPNVKTGKTLSNFYGAMIGAGNRGGGTVATRYALVTAPDSGNVGLNTTAPIAPFNLVADNSAGATRASQMILQGKTNPNLRLNFGIHTETTPAYADLSLVEEGISWRNVVLAGGGGSVGIGTSNPSSRLTVNGTIESTSGGIKFPDGTIQATASVGGGGQGSISLSSPDSSIAIGGTLSAPTLTIASVSLNRLGGSACAPGNLLQWSGTTWACASLAAADGSVVVTSSGSSSSISVATQGITNSKIADGSVGTSKLADGSVTAAKLAPGAITATGFASLGPNAFTGEQSIQINSPTNYALSSQNSSTTGSAVGVYAESASTAGLALKASATALSGGATGVYATTESSAGHGVFGLANATTGKNFGVFGKTQSSQGVGVKGLAATSAGTTYGVYGETQGAYYSAGVFGIASTTTAPDVNYGVYGKSTGVYGIGVIGYAENTAISNGLPIGVVGQTVSPHGVGGLFLNTAASGDVLVLRNSSGNVWRVNNDGSQWMNGTMNTGGADFAEAIEPIRTGREYEPGDVLAISLSGDRKVELSNEAYSTRVIGVFATKPGILASRHGLQSAVDEVPVAMIGIVPARASAENGPIQRGDLLVSAATPGHVMRATDRMRFTGAIVGKAMQPLDSGTGLIEIAVTLQ